jgi:hypothetical protein
LCLVSISNWAKPGIFEDLHRLDEATAPVFLHCPSISSERSAFGRSPAGNVNAMQAARCGTPPREKKMGVCAADCRSWYGF